MIRRFSVTLKNVSVARLSGPARQFEFHISRKARDRYQFDESLFSVTGNVILANFLATRLFAQKINDLRDIAGHPDQAILPGQLNAMGLIDEILHYVLALYREEVGADLGARVLDHVSQRLGNERTEAVLERFCHHFPAVEIYRGSSSESEWLDGRFQGVSHRHLALEELLLLAVANDNPALEPFMELFDDAALRRESSYRAFLDAAHEFFAGLPPFGPDQQNVLDMLRAPARAVPHSLAGQLQYIQERWGLLLGSFLLRLLGGLDFLKEENRYLWTKSHPGQGEVSHTGYVHSLNFQRGDEPERFSSDRDWMPRVILLAKSTLVWLDQLSRTYHRSIRTLDQIPDEELDQMASRGFNALWLIGLWERSTASKSIKQRCGNPEAEASAYSLHDYEIADELGGWPALDNLRDRCRQRGIRVASDMVPNHTAMDSRWVSEHPDWFLQLDACPYPSYRFDGPDLSRDARVEIKLEDHYYDRSDAAVVFRHVDKASGRHRYIYHGNDGTSMPWNDTAQLDYLNPDTREAVIQVILHVARNFPIIRFDAAMTLAKKHVQRLWYPVPGAGGAIASRSEHALSASDFDRAMPEEFWREVVDRVAKEVPDTLLLAEAFWMMEGYFVRSLGMHRVYNSAFMHMFKNEDNEKYRTTIKNTLEFDPGILKRFVNFMNNPDEETAAVQFGTGDKYFGVATVLATMPGTPMFGHGQVEGFHEKYGMEYRRAYWDEKPQMDLVDRHSREIFPLLHRRYLFAEVAFFRLYDLKNAEGQVCQSVFAYSNGTGTEHALVLFNNTWERVSGRIHTSSPYVEKRGSVKTTQTQTLAQALGLTHGDDRYLVFREQSSGLWFVRSSREIHQDGLYVELQGYEKQVFLDIHEVGGGLFGTLCQKLNGAGVAELADALQELSNAEFYRAFFYLVGTEGLASWAKALDQGTGDSAPLLTDLRNKVLWLYGEANAILGSPVDYRAVVDQVMADWKALVRMARLAWTGGDGEVLVAWILLGRLGQLVPGALSKRTSYLALVHDWGLDRRLTRVWSQRGVPLPEAQFRTLLVGAQADLEECQTLAQAMERPELRRIAGVNTYEGVVWIDRQGLEQLVWWLMTRRILEVLASSTRLKDANALSAKMAPVAELGEAWLAAAAQAGYRLEPFLASLETPPAAPRPKRPRKKPSV